MTGLDISQENLETEKRVVIEEYKQRYLNQPYGDMSMLLRALAYRVHPYRWATIGLRPITSPEPRSTKCAISTAVSTTRRTPFSPSRRYPRRADDRPVRKMVRPDRGQSATCGIASAGTAANRIPTGGGRTQRTSTMIVLAYHIGSRTSPDFFLGDMTSDLLAGGESGRLYQHLVREQRLLGSVNAYVSGEVDPGLFVFTAQLLPSTTVEQAEAALLREIEILQTEKIDEYELEKIKNKFEANTLFGELNVMNKAMNLGFYEMLGDLPSSTGK